MLYHVPFFRNALVDVCPIKFLGAVGENLIGSRTRGCPIGQSLGAVHVKIAPSLNSSGIHLFTNERKNGKRTRLILPGNILTSSFF
jgi:hypothetical protein